MTFFVIINIMKIGIISDTHDNLPKFKKVIDYLEKEGISFIIHCGDIANPDTLEKALENFSGKCRAVLGNADNIYQYDLEDYQSPPKIEVFERKGEVELSNKKMAFTHYPWVAKKLAKSGEYDIVFYGHTHRPWQKKIGECQAVNPGNVAGIIFRPSFAIYDIEEEKLELKFLDKI